MTFKRAVIVVYVLLVVGSFVGAQLMPDWSMVDIRPTNEGDVHRIMMGVTALYVFLAAIPFVPGAEIGFGLLLMFGANVAALVYLSMVTALCLAFLAGRFLPPGWVSGFFGRLGWRRAEKLVEECHRMDLSDRADFLADHVPTRVLPFLLRHRYIALAVLLNTPGNTVLGGGGGIGFAAGASRLFGLVPFVVCVMIAVAPVPLAFVLFGWSA